MKKLLLILLLSPLFFTRCYAESLYSQYEILSDAYTVQEALPEAAHDISGDLRLDGSYDMDGALRRLYRRFIERLCAQVSEELRSMSALFAVALLCALACTLCRHKEIREIIDRVSCCVAVLLVSAGFEGLLNQAGETVCRLADYSHVILPVIFTAAAAGGAVISASSRFAAACLAMDVMITVGQRYVLPLIYMYFVLSVSQSLYENGIIQALARLSKWCITTAMTVLTLAFGAYLSITGLIAGSGDAVAVKTARTVISRALPIVGGLLSDSAAVLLSAASIIKNSLGVFTLIAVCALCIGPVAVFSIKLLLYKAMAAATEFLPGARFSRLIGAMGTVFGMLLGLIGCCAIMLFMAVVSGIKVVNPI